MTSDCQWGPYQRCHWSRMIFLSHVRSLKQLSFKKCLLEAPGAGAKTISELVLCWSLARTALLFHTAKIHVMTSSHLIQCWTSLNWSPNFCQRPGFAKGHRWLCFPSTAVSQYHQSAFINVEINKWTLTAVLISNSTCWPALLQTGSIDVWYEPSRNVNEWRRCL